MKVSQIAKKIYNVADSIVETDDPTPNEMIELAESISYLQREVGALKSLLFKVEKLSDEEFWPYVSKLSFISREFEQEDRIQTEVFRRVKSYGTSLFKPIVTKFGQVITVSLTSIPHPVNNHIESNFTAHISRRFSEFLRTPQNAFHIPMDEQVGVLMIRIHDQIYPYISSIREAKLLILEKDFSYSYTAATFKSQDSANDFILAMKVMFNEDWGVLLVRENNIYVANNKDLG